MAIVFASIVKREFIETFHRGLTSIGNIFADSFVQNVVPELTKFRSDAIDVLSSKTFFYDGGLSLDPLKVVDAKIQDIENKLPKEGLVWAEKELISLGEANRSEFKVVARLCKLYFDSSSQESASEHTHVSNVRKSIKYLESRESDFANVADYYYYSAQAHCKLSTQPLNKQHYDAALSSASKAIALEKDNPRWLSLLGLVHDTFGSPWRAFIETEKALTFASSKGDAENIARAKNNIAFYIAELGDREQKDVAVRYAQEAYEFDEARKEAVHISLDTLGFVLMTFAESQNELERALEAFEKAHALDKTDKDIFDHVVQARGLLEKSASGDC